MNEELSKLRNKVNQMDRVVVHHKARRVVLELFFSVILITGCVLLFLDYLANITPKNTILLILTLLTTLGLGTQLWMHVTITESSAEGLARRNVYTKRKKYDEVVSAVEKTVGLFGEHQLVIEFQDGQEWVVRSSQENYPEFMWFLSQMGVPVKSLSGVIEGEEKE